MGVQFADGAEGALRALAVHGCAKAGVAARGGGALLVEGCQFSDGGGTVVVETCLSSYTTPSDRLDTQLAPTDRSTA